MKKSLLTFAAALMLGASSFSASAEVLTKVVVGTGTYDTNEYPFRTMNGTSTPYSASQLWYGSSNLPTGTYTVEGINLPLAQGKTVPTSGKVQVSVYVASTTQDYNAVPLSTDQFTQVYDGVIDVASMSIADGVRFDFDKYYTMAEGENLVLGFTAQVLEDFSSSIYFDNSIGDKGGKCSNSQSATPVGLEDITQNVSWVPALSIFYEEGEVEKPSTGGGDTVELKDKVVQPATGGHETYELPFCNYFGLNAPYSGSQTIYPSSNLPTGEYTIGGLKIPMAKGKTTPTSGKIQLSVYLATTDGGESVLPLAADEFTPVFDGVLDFATNGGASELTIDFDKYFTVAGGENLVVGILSQVLEECSSTLYFDDDKGGCPVIYNRGSETPLDLTLGNAQKTNWCAALTISYAEGKVEKPGEGEKPVVVDMAVLGMTAPAVAMYVDKTYEFNVTVVNNGTEAVEEYMVEVYNAETDQVLAKLESPVKLYSGIETKLPVELNFSVAGEYKLAARAILEGDSEAANNACDAIDVTIAGLPYKALEVSGDAQLQLGDKGSFSVKVANEGNAELSGYTVELYLLRANMADKLIGTVNDAAAIAAGESTDVNFEYTFELGGDYQLLGKVFQGESEPSYTPEFNVNVAFETLSPVIDRTVVTTEGASRWYMCEIFSRQNKYNASQIVYPQSYFGDHANTLQIQSLQFSVMQDGQQHLFDPDPVKIYLAQTSENISFVSGDINPLPAEEFVLVYEGPLMVPAGDNGEIVPLDFQLQRPFSLENGKSLVVNVSFNNSNDGYSPALMAQTTEVRYVTYSYTNVSAALENGELTVYNTNSNVKRATANTLPCLTVACALEPLPAKADAKITSVVAEVDGEPSNEIELGEELGFRVTFENLGTVDIEDYSIELLSYDADNQASVLKEYTGTRFVGPEASANQLVKYTFETAGTYEVAARLVLEGDVDTENNTSDKLTILVNEKNSVADVLGNAVMAYNHATSVLTVNGNGVVSVADMAGRVVASYEVDGLSQIALQLQKGVYVVSFNGNNMKIRK